MISRGNGPFFGYLAPRQLPVANEVIQRKGGASKEGAIEGAFCPEPQNQNYIRVEPRGAVLILLIVLARWSVKNYARLRAHYAQRPQKPPKYIF